MAKIFVIPALLLERAVNILKYAAKYAVICAALNAAVRLARTYDENSFGPQVRAIAAVANSEAAQCSSLLRSLSSWLKSIADGFKKADEDFPKFICMPEIKKSGEILNGIQTSIYKQPISPVVDRHISGQFGTYHGTNKEFLQLHNGVDLTSTSRNLVISSMTPGEVIFAGFKKGGFGNVVKIKSVGNDQKNYIFTYAHLATIHEAIKSGKILEQETKIGTMGNSGLRQGTGVHLHLTIHEEGKGSDKYFKQFNDPINKTPGSFIEGDPQNRTYKAEMLANWVDPTPYIKGDGTLKFRAPAPSIPP